ncbi:hypothetical protein [Nitrosomonas sp. Nm58]|jgi:hypothetical protein|uniref:hypothetical protein n=1 Tax=Nitrosomonas sp. Nm58 TaxID=200126 RepID=UPI000B83BD3B|nr:hypothetical protein [Nitrosomonas sp. Nm58]
MSILVTLLLILSTSSSYALSIVYKGQECKEDYPGTKVTGRIKESRFEVIEHIGDGVYKLNLTGGLPIIKMDGNLEFCIDSGASSLGYESNYDSNFFALRKQSNEAVGQFNGSNLVIQVNAIEIISVPRVDSEYFVASSSMHSHSILIIMRFFPEEQFFRVENIIHRQGYIFFLGGLTSFPWSPQESIVPNRNDKYHNHFVSNIDFVIEP